MRPLTKSFSTKASALNWSQHVEVNPEEHLYTQIIIYYLRAFGDLLRKYGKEVTLAKKGRDKEHYRIRVLERSLPLWHPTERPEASTYSLV